MTSVNAVHKDADKLEIRKGLQWCYEAGPYAPSGEDKYEITTVTGKTDSAWGRLI